MYNSLTHPLTPVFCTPKDEAERRAWKQMFRISFGSKITPIQFRQNEIRLEERCRNHSVEYVPPQLTDSVEAIHERKTRLQKKCKAAADKTRRGHPSVQVQVKERARKWSRDRKGNPLNGKNSSELRNFRITGRGGTPNYSYLPVAPYSTFCIIREEEEGSSSVRSQLEPLTLGGQEQVELSKPITFHTEYHKVRVKKGTNVSMDGWRVEMCDTNKVLSAEIYVNDNCTKKGTSVGCLPSAGFFKQVKESTSVWLGGDYYDALEIFHSGFKVKDERYSDFEKDDKNDITVLVLADIPEGREDIIQEAKRIVDEYGSILRGSKILDWNGKELYDYLNDQGITRVTFEDVDFVVSAVTAGSNTHQIIQRGIMKLDYKAGRTDAQPPTRPRSKDTSGAKSNVYYPLTPIFCIPRDSVEESEWKERFLQSFHVTPVRFRLNEKKLKEGCEKHSVRYIAPQLEDSVDETLRRKYDMNVKLQSSRCTERRRKKRAEIWAEDRKRAEEERRLDNTFRAEEERKRWAALSQEEKAEEKAVEKNEEEKRKREGEEMKRRAAMSPEERAQEEAQARLKNIEQSRKEEELRRRWPFMSPEEKAQANQKTPEEEREDRERLRKWKEEKARDELKESVKRRRYFYYRDAGMDPSNMQHWLEKQKNKDKSQRQLALDLYLPAYQRMKGQSTFTPAYREVEIHRKRIKLAKEEIMREREKKVDKQES